MTVSTTLNKIIFAGNGGSTVFPFTFATPATPSDIQVFFTDASGNVSLLAPTAYTLIINPASGPDPTPVGGSVTYNPGSPIPVGTSLTILRTLPLLQNFSLANQATPYQVTIEAGLDYEMMVSQQVLEVQSRALVVPVSDPTPGTLPAGAARAGLILGFDSLGNPIAVSGISNGVVVSAPLIPVVTAASLAAARTALGLGSIVTESIGLGLQDNGAGSLQTFYGEVSDSSNQSVTSAFHAKIRAATGAITYTLPLTSTLFNGFGFWVYARTAAITFVVNAADAFDGAGTGASLTVSAGSRVFVSTNAIGTWYISGYNQPGFNAPLNLQLNASVSANTLTIAIKDANGNDPSPASPVIYTVSAGGNSVPRAITGPLSITVPSGGSLGTVNGQGNRIWVGIFDNGGASVLAVYNSLSGTSIVAWDETSQPTVTSVSAGSTSAQTWYGSVGLTGKAFRILGYVESTQATAGTWASTPSKIQLFGPGQKKPGDAVQEVFSAISSSDATSSASFVAFGNNRITITPSSAANLIRVDSFGTIALSNNPASANIMLSNGVVANTGLFGNISTLNNPAATSFPGFGASAALVGYNLPNTTSSVTYAVQGRISAFTLTYGGTTQMSAREIFV
jgi:hypothetical protein